MDLPKKRKSKTEPSIFLSAGFNEGRRVIGNKELTIDVEKMADVMPYRCNLAMNKNIRTNIAQAIAEAIQKGEIIK